MCEHILQTHKKTCGHACIAMLSGKTEKDIINIVGHSKGTKTKEVISALKLLNISNSGRLIRYCKKNQLPEIGIIKTISNHNGKPSGNWHWILKYKSQFIDPLGFENIRHLKFVSFIGIYNHA